MAVPDEVLKGLADLLLESTARITQVDGGLPAGACFFVSDSLLITNRHVVGEPPADGPQEVLVHPYGGQPESGTVLARSTVNPGLDVALVRVAPTSDRPAVVLHRALDRGEYVLAGYPREDFYTDLGPGAEVPPSVKGNPRNNICTTRPDLLRLKEVQLKPGFSGGPVLNATTGAVVAVTVYSEDLGAALGGAALPMELAVAAYPELAELATEPPLAAHRYKEILGRSQWEALGLVWSRDEQIDIHLTGKRSCWRIGLRKDDVGPLSTELTARELGDDMSEVLVQWARSAGRRDESEVLLLGRLLSAALFPPRVADRLPPPADRDSDPVLVRLHVDPAGPLADLPWELATDPADPERKRFLSATQGYAFVRVNPGAPVASGKAAEPRTKDEHMSVLRIVVQPDDTTNWPPVVDTKTPLPWPTSSKINEALATRVGAPKSLDGSPLFVTEAFVNPTLYDLMSRAQERGADIVHYAGFGYQEPEDGMRSGLDRSWIACWAGTSSDDLRYHKAKEVLREIAGLEPRLVVLEFGTPSLDRPYDLVGGQRCQPIGPALLEAADTLGLDAMVCTRPLHPIQYDRFNAMLYTLLGAGHTIEQAVQSARRALLIDAPVDHAGFGWFVVTTGNSLRRRFYERPLTVAYQPPRLNG